MQSSDSTNNTQIKADAVASNGQESAATQAPVATQPAAPTEVAPSDEIDIETFAKIKFRVATIEKVEQVPESKKLYQIQLDVGELGKRQIVSGIAQHYTPEQLVGRQIVIVANLKPAKLMGVESRGMLLAASTDDDAVLAVLSPDKPIVAGARVR
jgi:methionyl-tRNA synthetase